MKTSIPTVRFELSPIDLEADLLQNFSDPSGRFSAVISKVYPKLQGIISETKNISEAKEACKKFAERLNKNNKIAISKAKDEIEKDWGLIGKDFLRILSEHMETDWPEDKPVITGYISTVPICPRFLDDYSFCISFWKPVPEARVTIAHEILHFLWFKKWKEVFGESSNNEYESPHLIWRLSEVMDPIILHRHPILNEMIKPVSWGYQSFEGLKIEDKSMSEHFANIYSSCLNDKMSFDLILRKVWEEAQTHRNILEKF